MTPEEREKAYREGFTQGFMSCKAEVDTALKGLLTKVSGLAYGVQMVEGAASPSTHFSSLGLPVRLHMDDKRIADIVDQQIELTLERITDQLDATNREPDEDELEEGEAR